MQQNVQYGLGYYTQPPVAPDYGPPYAPAVSQLPASAYSSAPSYDPAQNSSDPSYYAANHPYAPQVPSVPVADPSFGSPNSPYMSSNTLYNSQNPIGPPSYEATYERPNPQNPMGPPSYEAAYERTNPSNPTGPPPYEAGYERPFDYKSESLPHSISSPALPAQPHGSNPTMYRSGSYQDGFPQAGSIGSSPQVTGYADQGSGAFISPQPSGYDQRDSAYLQGGGYERSGFEQLGSYGQGNYDNGPQDSYKFADIYAYDGGQVEPYGSRGTRPIQTSSIFNPLVASGDDAKIARSSLKPDVEGGGSGVLKYRVKLLSESTSLDPPTDVICQIGLDGVRMLVPATNKMLRIYPLDTITKWEVSDSSTLTFWAKTTVDVEQRRVRLQSNSYTTSAILDTLTAACVQMSEMVDKDTPSEASKSLTSTSSSSEPGSAKKSSFADWVTLKPKSASQEEKQHWVPDEAVKKCTSCGSDFGAFIRRHHCRNCGDIFCDKCTRGRTPLTSDQDAQPVRVCDQCLAEVTQRLMNVESNNKPALQRPHEDFAKKLQEEMEKNAARKQIRSSSDNSGSSRPVRAGSSDSFVLNGPPHLWSSQPAPERSGPRMREVACPTCTVHLEVQVPSFGTETVECGVCQHPFLVSAD